MNYQFNGLTKEQLVIQNMNMRKTFINLLYDIKNNRVDINRCIEQFDHKSFLPELDG